MRTRTPRPISETVVCSECGLSWTAHVKRVTDVIHNSSAETLNEGVTLEDCVALLKAEVARRRPPPPGIVGPPTA